MRYIATFIFEEYDSPESRSRSVGFVSESLDHKKIASEADRVLFVENNGEEEDTDEMVSAEEDWEILWIEATEDEVMFLCRYTSRGQNDLIFIHGFPED